MRCLCRVLLVFSRRASRSLPALPLLRFPQEYDPHLSGFLRLTHVPFLLRSLAPPFDLLAHPAAARERRHVTLRVTGGTMVYFGDVLTALLAAVYDVDVSELPPKVAAAVARTTDVQRKKIVALFAEGGDQGGARARARGKNKLAHRPLLHM